nr:488_t:CDS:1 [Entrophospora candida]
MKQLKILESYAEWVKNKTRHQYEILSFQLASDKNNGSGSEGDIRPIKKKTNVDLTDFSQFYDSDNDEIEENEIDKYLSSKVQKELDLNILEWWKAHQDHYPKLSILCSYYLSIPASSAPSERSSVQLV